MRCSGWIYERVVARLRGTEPCDLYHAALIATQDGQEIVIEMAPIPDADGARRRGVVAEGPVGLAALRRLRLFRYEIRRWPGGNVPDLHFAVASPVRLSEDPAEVADALSLVDEVPTPVWGRDELGVADMWNSNSVVSWVLTHAGLLPRAGAPPEGGRAPGWRAGVSAAVRRSVEGSATDVVRHAGDGVGEHAVLRGVDDAFADEVGPGGAERRRLQAEPLGDVAGP